MSGDLCLVTSVGASYLVTSVVICLVTPGKDCPGRGRLGKSRDSRGRVGKAASRDKKGCPRLENLSTNIKKSVSTRPHEERKGWTGHPWAVVSIGTKQPAKVKPGRTYSERKLVRRGRKWRSQVSKEIGSGDCRGGSIYAGAW